MLQWISSFFKTSNAFTMLDLHSHILNDIDDGPSDIEGSIQLAAQYEKAGFSHVVATPHFIPGTTWTPDADVIKRRIDVLNAALEKFKIALVVFPGMEIAMDDSIPSLLSQKKLLLLAGSSYILIETPFQRLPPEWEHLFFTITSKGYRLVLAHPERCAQIMDHPEITDRIIAAGVYFQSNYDSFIGAYGDKILKTAWHLLDKGHIHYLATDSHDTVHRHPGNVAKAIQILKAKVDHATVNRITIENPKRLIAGVTLESSSLDQPVHRMEKKRQNRWRLF